MKNDWSRYTMSVTILEFFGGSYKKEKIKELSIVILNFSESLGIIDRDEFVELYFIIDKLTSDLQYEEFRAIKQTLTQTFKKLTPHPELTNL